MTGFDNSSMRGQFRGLTDRERLVFLDLEASGLERGSWPIEIGWAWVGADDTVSVEAHLIRPHPDWSMKYWSHQSADVHGIARSSLDDAELATDIAHHVIEQLAGRIVVSDAPEFDERWLLQLTRTVDPDLVIPIHDFDAVLAASCDREGLHRAYAALDGLPAPHRAGEDAARLARAWLAGATR